MDNINTIQTHRNIFFKQTKNTLKNTLRVFDEYLYIHTFLSNLLELYLRIYDR